MTADDHARRLGLDAEAAPDPYKVGHDAGEYAARVGKPRSIPSFCYSPAHQTGFVEGYDETVEAQQ